MLRSVTFPLIGPIDADWKDLRTALAVAWAESTALANWGMTELAKADVIRRPGDEKCPPMPPIYLYGLAGKIYSGWPNWSGVRSAAQSVLRSVEHKYRKVRYETIWTRARALPTQKYPMPYPVHNSSWSASFQNESPVVSLALGGRGWQLRLKGGHEMRRQLKAFAQIVSGAAVQGELALYRVRAHPGDHRRGVMESGSGQRFVYRVMVKLVAWLPRTEKGETAGTMIIKTAPDSFWLGVTESGRAWDLHADHVRRWVANHWHFLRRISDDSKQEKRWRRNLNAHREERCAKHHNRIKTFQQQAAAMAAKFAARQRLAAIVYDDRERGYFADGFDWSGCRLALAKACDDYQIELAFASDEVVKDDDLVEADVTV